LRSTKKHEKKKIAKREPPPVPKKKKKLPRPPVHGHQQMCSKGTSQRKKPFLAQPERSAVISRSLGETSCHTKENRAGSTDNEKEEVKVVISGNR